MAKTDETILDLEIKLEAKTKECNDLAEQLLKLKADFQELKKQTNMLGILSIDEAKEHITAKAYKLPPQTKEVLVTQDGFVFCDNDLYSGQVYAKEKNLKFFRFPYKVAA